MKIQIFESKHLNGKKCLNIYKRNLWFLLYLETREQTQLAYFPAMNVIDEVNPGKALKTLEKTYFLVIVLYNQYMHLKKCLSAHWHQRKLISLVRQDVSSHISVQVDDILWIYFCWFHCVFLLKMLCEKYKIWREMAQQSG